MSGDLQEKADRIFHQARELSDPAAREAFLVEACAGDTDLRSEVEAFLRADEKAAAFFDPRIGKETVRLSDKLSEGPGTVIDRYKLLEQIGEGGMGVVYMAEQQEPVSRKVALKIIKLGMDTKAVVARFEAERQALALMDHPHIARVLDAGATQTGRPYFVMDMVRGIPITEYCDKQKLTTKERLELFIPVCQAIQHAHQKGVIHRDLKPSNVMVTLSDGSPHPMVIDFGVAKATNQKLTERTLFTGYAQMIGTPAYMSPEQAEMSRLDVDTRSDVYSLGVLLYELLTGTQPFSEEELRSASWAEMQQIIAEQEPPRPSTRLDTLTAEQRTALAKRHHESPGQLSMLLKGDLDWIVMKCLEKDRRRRYETANGLARDIHRHLANEPVAARPPSRLYELQKAVRRHKVGFAAAGFVALALSLGLAVATIGLVRERAARERAVAAEEQAQAAAAKSEQVARFMKDMLKGVGPSVAEGRDTELLREILDDTASRLDALQDQPEVEADLRQTLGAVYEELSEYALAARMFERALGLRRGIHGSEHLSVARTLNSLATVYYRQARQSDAEQTFLEALDMLRGLPEIDALAVADSLHGLAEVRRADKNKRTEAEDLELEALNLRREHLGNESLEVAESLSALGILLRNFPGREADSEDYLTEALEIRRKISGERSLEAAATMRNLGYLMRSMPEKNAQGVELLKQALEIQREILGDHRNTAITLYFLGSMVKEPAEAERFYRQALAMQRDVLRPGHTDIGKSYENLFELLSEHGKLEEAAEVLRDYNAWHREHSGGELDTFDWAETLRSAGYQTQAEEFYVQSAGVRKLNRHPEVLAPFTKLAQMLQAADRFSDALAWAKAGVLCKKQFEADGIELSTRWVAGFGRRLYSTGLDQDFEGIARGLAAAGDSQMMDLLARLYATNPDAEIRDGRSALEQAERAVEATGRTNALYLATLAAAHAELGQFTNAVSVQIEAVGMLGDESEDVAYNKARLRLYRQEQPFREYWRKGTLAWAENRWQDAEDLAGAELGMFRMMYDPEDIGVTGSMMGLARAQIYNNKFAEAEAPARDAVRIREKSLGDRYLTFNARSVLGDALRGQGRYEEAELLLLSGYKGMKEIDHIARSIRIEQALERLVKLYEGWGKPIQADQWKTTLTEFKNAPVKVP